MNQFTEKERMILQTFEKTLPKMSEMEKEKLLSFGEGIAFKADMQEKARGKEAMRQQCIEQTA